VITSSSEDQEAAVGLVSHQQKTAPTTRKKMDVKSGLSVRSIVHSLLFSKWIAAALLLLFVANVLYLFAFVTTGWGRIRVGSEADFDNITQPIAAAPTTPQPTEDVYWNFGLWQSCRSTDNVCTGTRFPCKSCCVREGLLQCSQPLTREPYVIQVIIVICVVI
jgi:hypothetical protein